MQCLIIKKIGLITAAVTTITALVAVPVSALDNSPVTNGGSGSPKTGSSTTTGDQQKLTNLKQRGEGEITRRLTSLNELIAKINATTKLTASDKAALIAEVNSEITGLNSLKTTVADETDFTTAKTDAQSIITGYRVYAFIFPKVSLIVTADRQQVTESKLSTLATSLQTAIATAKTAGKDVTALQTELNDLIAKNQAAQTISSNVETSVLALQPTDYNNDHKVLGGYRDQLKTAHADIMTAVNDSKAIVTALKNL